MKTIWIDLLIFCMGLTACNLPGTPILKVDDAIPSGIIDEVTSDKLLIPEPGSSSSAIIIDHTTADITLIPPEWLQAARENIVWFYGHTSHGSQLITGSEYLRDLVSADVYNFVTDWQTVPDQIQPSALRLADDGDWSWEPSEFIARAREFLDRSDNQSKVNAFMWSWCGQLSEEGTDVQGYLEMMSQLESEYPNVRFVYMTGHTDGGSEILTRNNQIIRDWVIAHNGILFDFADIESWDPAGNYYPQSDDSCSWCADWCREHSAQCRGLPGFDNGCAHTEGYNCLRKAQAFWWLSARLAGWNGEF